MNNRVGLLIGVVAACAWPVLAQSGGAGGTGAGGGSSTMDMSLTLLMRYDALRTCVRDHENFWQTDPHVGLRRAAAVPRCHLQRSIT